MSFIYFFFHILSCFGAKLKNTVYQLNLSQLNETFLKGFFFWYFATCKL